MEADQYLPTMSNRMTLMDGDVPHKFPGEGARVQATRFPICWRGTHSWSVTSPISMNSFHFIMAPSGAGTSSWTKTKRLRSVNSLAFEVERRDWPRRVTHIAESILERKVFSADRGLTDRKRIASIMIELMEPSTSILDPISAVLEEPEKWRDELGIKDFLAATQRLPLPQLKELSLPSTLWWRVLTWSHQHPFLPPKPQGSWLQPYVFAAVRAANILWDKPSLS